MKKMLVIVCLAATATLHAQLRTKLVSTNATDMGTITDAVLSSTKNKYTLSKDTTITSHDVTYFIKSFSSGDKQLLVNYESFKHGGNHDLGKPDTLYYSYQQILGEYQDLFTFWKSNFQPSADFEKIALAGHGEAQVIKGPIDSFTFAFNKQGKIWTIGPVSHF